MKNDKAAGPSDVVAEMLKALNDICCKIIVDLINTIFQHNLKQAKTFYGIFFLSLLISLI